MAVLNQKLLEQDVEKYLRTFAKVYCRNAQVEATKMAKYAIKQFYKDYKPDYYDRTFDLRDNSYSPYYHDNGMRIYGGVRINSDNMQPYNRGTKYETDPFEVADVAWHGWHGVPIRGIYTTPPLDIVKQMMAEENFLYKIRNNAESAAKSQSYTYLRF